jgi:hypothetical protein
LPTQAGPTPQERVQGEGQPQATSGLLHPDKLEGFTGTQGDDAPPYDAQNPDRHVYSRYTQPVMTRAEKVLSAALVSELVYPVSNPT